MVLWFHTKSCLEWTSNPGPCAYYGHALTTELSDWTMRERVTTRTFSNVEGKHEEKATCVSDPIVG